MKQGKEAQPMGPLTRRKTRQREGFRRRGMRWLYRVLRPFFHCRVKYPPGLEDSQDPVVFIANHYNVFGPLSFCISVSLEYQIWINSELVDERTASEGIHAGIRQILPFLSDAKITRICEKIVSLVLYALRNIGMIPVDRQDASKLLSTMRNSIAALQEGKNLLIFPETGIPEYSLTSVTPFFSGFATLGRLYHRKTGKCLRFVPCYIDEQHYQIRMGEPVIWNPEEDPRVETERISDELNLCIREMAAENRGVEKEKNRPRPLYRTILFFCNLIRFLLLIPLTVALGISNRGMILPLYMISEGIRVLFNAVCSVSYVATNRAPFLFSHTVGILTDLAMLIYLAGTGVNKLYWLVLALGLNGAAILVSNIIALSRFRRCSGLNYFDTLSANLLCVLVLRYLLQIRLTRLVSGALFLAVAVSLLFSTCFSLAFNARIGREEREE
ncbi:MAG: hypothetical protein II888_07180 [Clostridia bacterium]|nr:hypothetical protein [Clostridia bacterium]